MYFSEQGNVDDDATFITIFLVSFNLQSCCLMQSAVCSLQMSYTEFSTGSYFTKTKAMVKIQKKNFGLGFSQ